MGSFSRTDNLKLIYIVSMEHNDTQQTDKSITKKVAIPFVIFILLFFGVGFISGGVVHLGEGFNFWDISLVGVGILLFVTGSYIQEVVFNKKNLAAEGIIPFLFYSLLLSIGVGMASGGIQHFVDTPKYSMFLIPLGLLLGVFAFIFKQNIKLTKTQWTKLVPGAMVLALFIGISLFASARFIPQNLTGHDHAEHGHGQQDQPHAEDHHSGDDHPHN